MPALQTGSSSPSVHQFQRETLLTECGRGSAIYRPDLDPEFPWASYWNGTPGACFETSERVASHFRTVRRAKLQLTGD